MTALLTALTVLLPTLTVAVAAATEPTDANGNRVNRHRRSLTGDLRYLVTRTGY
jgi:hypothetical protein